MVTDDLTVTPLCVTSSLSILDRQGIPLSDVEELELNIGLEEALSILKASLTSTSALTNGLFEPSIRTVRPMSGGTLHPRSVFDKECRKLKLVISGFKATNRYFTCGRPFSGKHNFSMYYDTVRCDCGKTMSTQTILRSCETSEDGDDRAFCTKGAFFIISDDMRVVLAGPVLRTLAELGIRDTKGAEMRNVTFGYNEIIDLLQGMFMSRTPLTDVIIGKAQSLSILDRLGIPLSDVEELELNIGLEEALSILKASLASTSALTNGLFEPSLRKCVKQEQH
ncbi:Protein of unknown function (DUF674 [Striga hermonthica]|uniref:DUF674 family protein n=1 Tax=Striga hermonthica TaxID=68872 RepID=A0A9N7R384_STRHE|nr:Protein of unknown function (DUF674 [Striga hermonthica]